MDGELSTLIVSPHFMETRFHLYAKTWRRVAVLAAGVITTLILRMPAEAVPPLINDDAKPTEKHTFEIYAGYIYDSEPEDLMRDVIAFELDYGISDRQDISFEMPLLSHDGQHGFGDITIGTEYVLVKETTTLPAVALGFEWKLRNGSFTRGLGSGSDEYEFRMPLQKTWGWFTLIGNAGYTIVTEPESHGVREPRRNAWFAGLAQEYKVTRHLTLLSELYLETADEPGTPNRFSANVGFEREITEDFSVQAAFEHSLRETARGGPDSRVYVGIHWTFDAPWKREDKDKDGGKGK